MDYVETADRWPDQFRERTLFGETNPMAFNDAISPWLAHCSMVRLKQDEMRWPYPLIRREIATWLLEFMDRLPDDRRQWFASAQSRARMVADLR